MTNIKAFIISELRSRKISQVAIARMLRVNPVCVNEVITGKRKNPRIRTAIALAIGKPETELWPPTKEQHHA